MQLKDRILDILKDEQIEVSRVRGVPIPEIIETLDDESVSIDQVKAVIQELLDTDQVWVYGPLLKVNVDDLHNRYMWSPGTFTLPTTD